MFPLKAAKLEVAGAVGEWVVDAHADNRFFATVHSGETNASEHTTEIATCEDLAK